VIRYRFSWYVASMNLFDTRAGMTGLLAAVLVTASGTAAALTELSDIIAISVGFDHACGITTQGAVKCWGYNGGTLGDGTDFVRNLPVDVIGLDEPAVSISAGDGHTCAILASGGLKCWGHNDSGKIDGPIAGTSGKDHYWTAVDALPAGSSVSAVTAGRHQTCAVASGSAALSCWGITGTGLSPESLFSQGATGVATGANYFANNGTTPFLYLDSSTCVLVNGGVQCWGSTGNGSTVPVGVAGLSAGVQAISAGGGAYSSGIVGGNPVGCALMSTTGVKCWTLLLTDPEDVPGLASGVASVSVGTAHQCALTIGGGVKCWGSNSHGQLGSGATSDESLRDVPGLTSGVVAVGSGFRHSCALLDTGKVRCWGDNTFWQMASGGAFVPSNPPSPVLTGIVPRLANLSTRASIVTSNDVTIGGFAISGSASKTVVVRGIGPSLVNFGIRSALGNPTLQLVRSSDQSVIAANDDWQSAANADQLSASGFAPSHPLESAIHITLEPGLYSAILSGAGGSIGVGLVEVYEVDRPEVPLINISTRAQVQAGEGVMIAGFVISGEAPQLVVVRAIGPSLAYFGVSGALADPTLQLVRQSDGTPVASNDDWASADPESRDAIYYAGLAPSDFKEAAISVMLPPGAYTAIVSGAGGGTGTALVEVYAR